MADNIDNMGMARDMVDVAGRKVASETAFAALQELALDNVDDIDSFAEFMEMFIKYDGDLSKITTRTHEPVDVDTFIDDPYFLNLRGHVYPELRKAVKEIIEGGFVEALFMGSIGIGKTTGAQIVQARHVYELSCEKFPQAKFGLMPTSTITIAMLNRSDALASAVTYGEFRSLMEAVPYFTEMYPFIRDKKSSMEFPSGGLKVIPSAAFNNKLLGMNIIGCIADEMNFMQIVDASKQSRDGGEFNQAKIIYNALVRRRKSRFLQAGKLPGCICVVSSKGGPDDFTEMRKREVEAEDAQTTYVWDKAQWEVVPQSRFSGEKFFIEVGTERTNSRIIESKADAAPGADVIEAPVEFKSEFMSDMEGSLRDYAGRSTLSKRPFFYDRDKIWECADRWEASKYMTPFGNVQRVVMSPETLPSIVKNYVVPNPTAVRVAHIDLGITGDACGFAVGHVSRIVTQRVRGKTGAVLEDLPEVTYDCVLQLVPPRGGEMEISLVRQLLYMLRDAGLPIQVVTFDQFQSTDSQQILRRKGFHSEHLSVDGTVSEEAYKGLRSGMFNDRVLCPESATGFKELATLEKTAKGAIDHVGAGSSKDVADALCGVHKSLMLRRSTWRNVAASSVISGSAASLTNSRPSGKDRPQGRPDPARPTGRKHYV
jgi:hypothetical protein